MSVGNIVTATIELYRARFREYFSLALQSVLWVLGPILLLLLGFGLMIAGIGVENFESGGNEVSNTSLIGLGVLVLVASVVVGIYCGARSLLYGATISRLAFLDLRKTPETRTDAYRFVRRRMWKFFLAALWVGLILFGAYIGVMLVVMLLAVIGTVIVVAATGGQLDPATSPEATIIIGLLTVLITFAVIISLVLVFAWLSARFFVYDTSLAIEERLEVTETVTVSWRLTRNHAFRVLAVILITYLVSLPVGFVVQVVATIAQMLLMFGTPLPEELAQVAGFLVGLVIGLAGNLLLLPLWQVVKSIIYYDLKTRKEGIDLKLSDA